MLILQIRLSRGGGRVGGRGAGGESRLKGREVIVTEHCSTDFFQSQFLILASGNICRGPSSQWWIFVGGQGNARQVLWSMITDQIIHHHVSHIDDFFFNQTSNIAMHWEEKDSVWVFIVLVFFFCCKCSPQSLFFSTLLTQGWGVCWRCEASAARIPEERRRAAWSWGLRGDCDDHGGGGVIILVAMNTQRHCWFHCFVILVLYLSTKHIEGDSAITLDLGFSITKRQPARPSGGSLSPWRSQWCWKSKDPSVHTWELPTVNSAQGLPHFICVHV